MYYRKTNSAFEDSASCKDTLANLMKKTESIDFRKHFMENAFFLEKHFRLKHLLSGGNATNVQSLASFEKVDLKNFLFGSTENFTFSDTSMAVHHFFQYAI